jgi:hypothetical protein
MMCSVHIKFKDVTLMYVTYAWHYILSSSLYAYCTSVSFLPKMVFWGSL